MPYDQTPVEVVYPPIETDAWVIISRLTETAIKVVPNLNLIEHSSEFALPFPTGKLPEKVVSISVNNQKYDSLNRPLYDDGASGTTSESDINGKPYPPLLETVSQETIVNLLENPELFTLNEVVAAVEEDFLGKFPFYNWARLVIFDQRFDATSVYESQQPLSGFAVGNHPIFVGPIYGRFDTTAVPVGHLLLVAPVIEGIDWLFQIRHGIAGVNTQTGPIADVEQASRLGEIQRIYPMENFPVTSAMIVDADGAEQAYFWIRTDSDGVISSEEEEFWNIPFIIIMGRSTGNSGDQVNLYDEDTYIVE